MLPYYPIGISLHYIAEDEHIREEYVYPTHIKFNSKSDKDLWDVKTRALRDLR